MLKGFIIFILQVFYLGFRVKNIQAIEDEKPLYASTSSMIMSAVGLAASYLGIVDGLMEGNWWIVVGYLLGSGVGTYVAMKM